MPTEFDNFITIFPKKIFLLQYANNNRILMPPTFLFKFFVKSSFDLDFSQVFLIIKIVQMLLVYDRDMHSSKTKKDFARLYFTFTK